MEYGRHMGCMATIMEEYHAYMQIGVSGLKSTSWNLSKTYLEDGRDATQSRSSKLLDMRLEKVRIQFLN